jgi:hypothetical protein
MSGFRSVVCVLTLWLAVACAAPAASPAPPTTGLVRVKLGPPDATGVTLGVHDEAGRPVMAQVSLAAPGCLEAALPAPGRYQIAVARNGSELTSIGPIDLLPGATTIADVQLAAVAPAATPPKLLVGDFSASVWDSWQNTTYFPWSPKNDYQRERGPDGSQIAHVISDRAGSMFVRAVHADLNKLPIARWRWRVPGPIAGADERQNATDDAAARVYFAWGVEGKADLTHAEALGYIWGQTRRVGESGASPFSPRIGIYCLRSGRTGAGSWQDERRDILADYRAYFKHAPTGPLTAIAILTDTDNTKGHAEAWYGPITLESR